MRILKLLIFIPLIISSSNLFGQISKLVGTWITNDNEALVINVNENTTVNDSKISNCRNSDKICVASIHGNLLSFDVHYFTSGEHSKHGIYHYGFNILSETDSILMLKPCSTLSKSFFNNQQQMKFIRQRFVIDTTIHFEKLLYHTYGCIGLCPTYHLEIDNKRKVRLFAEQVFHGTFADDTAKQGYYVGYLDNYAYDSLIEALQTCRLKTLDLPELHGFDAPPKNIIIYFNGEKKYFSMIFTSAILDHLIETLDSICEKNTFDRVTEPFTLEE